MCILSVGDNRLWEKISIFHSEANVTGSDEINIQRKTTVGLNDTNTLKILIYIYISIWLNLLLLFYLYPLYFFFSIDSKYPVVTCSFTVYTMYLNYFNTKIIISVFSYSKIDRDCWKGLDCTITRIVNTVIKLYGLKWEST